MMESIVATLQAMRGLLHGRLDSQKEEGNKKEKDNLQNLLDLQLRSTKNILLAKPPK